jgi:hypothetical protein
MQIYFKYSDKRVDTLAKSLGKIDSADVQMADLGIE